MLINDHSQFLVLCTKEFSINLHMLNFSILNIYFGITNKNHCCDVAATWLFEANLLLFIDVRTLDVHKKRQNSVVHV